LILLDGIHKFSLSRRQANGHQLSRDAGDANLANLKTLKDKSFDRAYIDHELTLSMPGTCKLNWTRAMGGRQRTIGSSQRG
jgi:hypothetical protein